MRSYEIEGLDLLQCFRPNDIVKAKILSEQIGGKESSTMLSTVETDMGVVFSRCEETGKIMFPRSYTSSQCPVTGIREKRKNATPSSRVLNTNNN